MASRSINHFKSSISLPFGLFYNMLYLTMHLHSWEVKREYNDIKCLSAAVPRECLCMRMFINSLVISSPNPHHHPIAHPIKINLWMLSQNKAHLRSLITSGEATTTANLKPVLCSDFPLLPYTWELHTAILHPQKEREWENYTENKRKGRI